MSRKEKLAEEYAKDWEIRKAFLAGYAACEKDARGMEEALAKIKEIKFIAGRPNIYDESKHTEFCKTNGCYGHWSETEFPDDIAKAALEKWKERGE